MSLQIRTRHEPADIDWGLQDLERLIISPPPSRVTYPGMHVCILYSQPLQCARSEWEIVAVCWQLACIFRLPAWFHPPDTPLATQERLDTSYWLTVASQRWRAVTRIERSVVNGGMHSLLPLTTNRRIA
jgi:hypothetical protein